MKYELAITADTNDGDYVTSTNEVTLEFINEHIVPVVNEIKNCTEHYNWPTGDHGRRGGLKSLYPNLTEDQIEIFNDFKPYGEYGIHTIESVVYYPLPTKTELL